jgi:hypothetical protein
MMCSPARTNAGTNEGRGSRRLSPEEDVVGAILDEEDDIDDSLPADLWFRFRVNRAANSRQAMRRHSLD